MMNNLATYISLSHLTKQNTKKQETNEYFQLFMFRFLSHLVNAGVNPYLNFQVTTRKCTEPDMNLHATSSLPMTSGWQIISLTHVLIQVA